MSRGLSASVVVETDLFEHRVVGADFVNPCSFGRDFAEWLRSRLVGVEGLEFDEPAMEDYGWGFGVRTALGKMWIALSYGHDGPVEGPATWTVSVDAEGGWFRKPDEAGFRAVVEAVRRVLVSEPEIHCV